MILFVNREHYEITPIESLLNQFIDAFCNLICVQIPIPQLLIHLNTGTQATREELPT